MTNEQAVTKKEETLPTTTMDTIDMDDIEIPSIRCLQGISEKTNEDGYNAGDFIRSTDDKVLGGKDKPFGVFIVKTAKTITRMKHNGTKWDWAGMDPWDANTFHYGEYEQDGEKRKDMKTFIYTVLLESEIKTPGIMPATFQFKSTALKTAKKINTKLMNNKNASGDEAATVFEIGSKQEKNDLGTYFVPTFKEGRKTAPEELAVIQQWRAMLNTSAEDANAPF